MAGDMMQATGEQRVLVPKARKGRVRVERDWSVRGTQPAMPDWLEARDYQLDVVDQIEKEYARGTDVVMLDAPTGTGKTAIAEMVRRVMGVERGLYVCTTKSLQAQVVRDFPYARVLKGRTNYTPTKLMSREATGYRQGVRGSDALRVTCADCDAGPPGVPRDEQTCSYCEFVDGCPYLVARQEAERAPVGVLNTSYLLAECNGPGKFAGRGLVVADEADLLEDELLGYVELRVPRKVLGGLEVPKKGSHMTTIRTWLAEEVEPQIIEMRRAAASQGGLEGRREYTRLDRLVGDVRRVVEREDGWVRDGDEEDQGTSLVLKPVSVEDVAGRYLWRHGEKWLLMSGTTVSAECQADALGIEEAGLTWAPVSVPMQFAKESRHVVFVPAGSMTRKGQEAGEGARVLQAIKAILIKHPDVNVLVHTHTYKLAREVAEWVKVVERERDDGGRPVETYVSSWERDGALERFKGRAGKGGCVLVAASMDRGVDLPGDMCRVQVIAKMPMASLGSRQVSERMRRPGGQAWYLMGTIRTLMQMCGRAVRGREDWAITYVVDSHFGKLLRDGKQMGMFPEWWLDGLEVGRVKEYL